MINGHVKYVWLKCTEKQFKLPLCIVLYFKWDKSSRGLNFADEPLREILRFRGDLFSRMTPFQIFRGDFFSRMETF